MKQMGQNPKIVFNSGKSAWIRQPLHICGTFNPPSILPEKFEYVDLESVVGTELRAHRPENRNNAPSRAQRLAQKHDIFYQMVRPYQKNNFLFDKEEKNFVFSTGYAQIRPSIDDRFLFSLMQRDAFVEEVLINCTGTSYPAISSTALANIDVVIPSAQEEQEKIGLYFKHIDIQLSNIGKELEKLRQLKAASLQAMFPQEGETAPRLRFKGFEGEWSKHSIGSLFSEGVERGTFDNLLSVSILRGVYPTEDFVKTHTVQDFSNYKSVHPGYIVYNSMRMWQGASGVSNYSGIVSPAYTILCPNEKVDSTFIAYLFKLPWMIKTFEANSQGLTKDTWNLKYPAISVIDICIPSDIREQKKIADFFLNLDKQIKLAEKKLEKLRQIKASCLDLMFV